MNEAKRCQRNECGTAARMCDKFGVDGTLQNADKERCKDFAAQLKTEMLPVLQSNNLKNNCDRYSRTVDSELSVSCSILN